MISFSGDASNPWLPADAKYALRVSVVLYAASVNVEAFLPPTCDALPNNVSLWLVSLKCSSRFGLIAPPAAPGSSGTLGCGRISVKLLTRLRTRSRRSAVACPRRKMMNYRRLNFSCTLCKLHLLLEPVAFSLQSSYQLDVDDGRRRC